MSAQIFDAALGLTPPWFVSEVDFDQAGKTLTLRVDFKRGSRFSIPDIESASIDMSPAFIKGIEEHLPNAWITFDKFHVIAHASAAVDKTRRAEQKHDPELKGTRWALLKDRRRLTAKQKVALARVTRQIC